MELFYQDIIMQNFWITIINQTKKRILPALCVVIIIAYLFSPLFKISEIWTNILLNIINLIVTIYVTKEISYRWRKTDNINNQKKIAKTAIRHIRTSLKNLISIIKIIDGKMNSTNNNVIVKELKEIRNYIAMMYSAISTSQNDFSELVNEEIQEQDTLEHEIEKILDNINSLKNELQEKEKKEKENIDIINDLKNKISKQEEEISSKAFHLPIINTYSSEWQLPFRSENNNLLENQYNLLENQYNLSKNNEIKAWHNFLLSTTNTDSKK